MKKYIYLVWAPARIARDRGAIRDLLVHRCGPLLLALEPAKLVVHVDDPESAMRPPSPFHPKGPPPIHGSVDLWLDEAGDTSARAPFERVLRDAGFTIAGYEVDESPYRDYGDNRHAPPRSWPDGVRSPGVGVLTLLERPGRLDHDEWMKRWHGVMSPVSEAIQPRTRYVRNRVVRAVTEGAPAIDGVVIEMWPSVRHVTNPFLYYGARTPVGVLINMVRILRALTSFHDLTRVRTTTCGEYFLKTGRGAHGSSTNEPPIRRSPAPR